jgi:hypothetical protein
MTSYLRRKRVPTRNINLEEPPNRWQLFVTWLLESLTPAVPVVSTVGASNKLMTSIISFWLICGLIPIRVQKKY